MEELQELKRQDKQRQKNLKMRLDLNAQPPAARKDSRAERMKDLEAKIVSRCRRRDSNYKLDVPPTPDEIESEDAKTQLSLMFTTEKNSGNGEVSIPVLPASDSWLDDFLTRN